jgi:hypothetical protein
VGNIVYFSLIVDFSPWRNKSSFFAGERAIAGIEAGDGWIGFGSCRDGNRTEKRKYG